MVGQVFWAASKERAKLLKPTLSFVFGLEIFAVIKTMLKSSI